MTKEEILKEYIKYRRQNNHSRNIRDIEFHIRKFINSKKKPLSQFNDSDLLDYFDKIRNKYTVSTLNSIKSSFIKNFIKYYYKDYSKRFLTLDRICKTEKVGETYKPDEMISEEDFKKLIKGEESTFWKAYFLTLFYGGCRPIEVCSLKWKDIEFVDDGAYLTIYSKKNKQSFIKFVPFDVAFYLKKLKNNDKEVVFYNKVTKDSISVKGAYHRLRKISKEVLGKQINLYLLRHSIATIIYNKEDIKDDHIARQMGHTASMKGKYVHNNLNKLKENAKKIYVSPEDLPPEKKHNLEIKIEKLQNTIKSLLEIQSKLLDQLDQEELKKEINWIIKANG